MKVSFKKFRLYIIASIFVFTALLSLFLGVGSTTQVNATQIPDGYATDPINAAPDELVWIPDQNLRRFLETKVGKVVGADITVQDMRNITATEWGDMDLSSENISDLTGIEFAINIEHLDLSFNQISDIAPLSNMTKLTSLYLNNNSIADVSGLSNLILLIDLNLCFNQIVDISGLSEMVDMNYLSLDSNKLWSCIIYWRGSSRYNFNSVLFITI